MSHENTITPRSRSGEVTNMVLSLGLTAAIVIAVAAPVSAGESNHGEPVDISITQVTDTHMIDDFTPTHWAFLPSVQLSPAPIPPAPDVEITINGDDHFGTACNATTKTCKVLVSTIFEPGEQPYEEHPYPLVLTATNCWSGTVRLRHELAEGWYYVYPQYVEIENGLTSTEVTLWTGYQDWTRLEVYTEDGTYLLAKSWDICVVTDLSQDCPEPPGMPVVIDNFVSQ